MLHISILAVLKSEKVSGLLSIFVQLLTKVDFETFVNNLHRTDLLVA